MAIYVKGEFKPLADILLDIDSTSPYKIVGLNRFQIELHHQTGIISATRTCPDSAQLRTYLKDINQTLPPNPVYEEVLEKMYQTVVQLLKSAKYLYGLYHLDFQQGISSSFYWSPDRTTWYPVADRRDKILYGDRVKYTLPDPLLNNFTLLLENGWTPLTAFEYLHQAYAERFNTRFQWINGATAAELGIKEFLYRLKPDVEVILKDIQSPPAVKLYKGVLESYTGAPSPYYKAIQKGTDLRNELIHKPSSPPPSYNDTVIYLHTIECALIHLHTLLNPANQFVSYLYTTAQQRLQEVTMNPRSIFH